jgi:drug/metabolite transporter (DMT)-like permease
MSYAFVSFFAWVAVDAAIKLGGQAALSPYLIMTGIGLVGAATIAITATLRGKARELRPGPWRHQIWMGLSSIGINLGAVVALKHLPLTLYYVVIFTAPLVIALLATTLKREILDKTKIVCLVAGFFGTIFAIGVGHGKGGLVGYIAGFSAVAFFAAYTLIVQSLSKSGALYGTQFINAAFVGIFGLAGAFLHPVALPGSGPLLMIAIAGSINAFANILYNIAINNTSPTNVMQLHYTQIVSGAILGYLLWHEVPSWNLLLGSTVIIASGLVVAGHAHRGRVHRPDSNSNDPIGL